MSLINKLSPSTTTAALALPNGSVDVRMIAVIRCILAISALVIAYVDPTQPAIFSALTYSSMVVYGIWSTVLAIMAFRRDPNAPPPRDTHWGDMLFCAYLVTLTQGTNSLFFSFFLFAILSASFSRGFQEGLLVTGVSAVLFILASLWFEPAAKFGFDQTLVRPIYLLTLGYMISYWGGHEITQRRRLRMLQEVNNHLDPRIGFDEAIRLNLERILHFYKARNCILVFKRSGLPLTYRTYYVSSLNRDQAKKESATQTTSKLDAINQRPFNDEDAKKLLDLPDEFSARFEQSPAIWKKYLPGYTPPDPTLTEELKNIACLLNTHCFLTAPYTQQDGSSGRIFITPDKRTFSQADVEFVSQLVLSISHIVESMQLMDELASESAKHERFRISLDIHDTTIQPYIGLKLGLDALNRQAGSDNPLSKDISELLNMTESTIRDLRSYVTNLREDKVLAGDSLITSIKEQAERFKRFYKINVTVKCDSTIRVNSRLAGDVVQIFAEGLSNILRHTKTRNVYLSINCDNQNLMLEIANETSDKTNSKFDFTPRSINARALSLGGTSCVKSDAEGYTVVHISIPI